MGSTPKPIKRSGTIKRRVLTIALIPSLAILFVGAGLSGYLVNQGIQDRKFASEVSTAMAPTTHFIVSTQEERRLTLLATSNPAGYRPALDKQRKTVDAALANDSGAGLCMTDRLANDPSAAFDPSTREIPAMRQRIDSGQATPDEIYDFYNGVLALCASGMQGVARSSSNADVSFEQMISYDLLKSAEAMSRSHAMAVRGISGGLNGEQFHELAHQLGMYHEQVESVVPRMTMAEQAQYRALKKTPAWKTLVADDNLLMTHGPTAAGQEVVFDIPAWESSAQQVGNDLMQLYVNHSNYAARIGVDSANRSMIASLAGGVTLLLIALTAFLIAMRLSTVVVRRLGMLRAETLDLSEHKLPAIVRRLHHGEKVDISTEVPWLDHGTDEIGQVANAFNEAQRTAVTTAVEEAETRQGVREVLLNIAHRSQIIVHRQLETLYEAQRSEDDPQQLELLFKLDHLATRSRRNAENLIIMGGGKPGRQWRNPVPLDKIVGSSIAETELYTRVDITQLPESRVVGDAVGDIAHLIAELVDNATTFSPPEARVELRGNVVGRGLVIRVEDQGVGMEQDQLDALNAMMKEPPDFSVRAMSTDSRVGLFVVAHLAARHGIRITFQESAYGGTVAIVLISSNLLVPAESPATTPAPDSPAAREAAADDPEPAEPSLWPEELPSTVRVSTMDSIGPNESKPPLPRRERQTNIVPQLREEPEQLVEAALKTSVDDCFRPEPESSRASMSAFQQGTLRARVQPQY